MSSINEILERNLHQFRAAPKMPRVGWQLDEGIRFIQTLEPRLKKIGAHCGMTGGTLFKGSSEKDLDVIIYPHSTTKCPALETVEEVLMGEGLTNLPKGGSQPEEIVAPSRSFSVKNTFNRIKNIGGDEKIVTVWTDQKGRRIDIFYLDFPEKWFAYDPNAQ